MNKGSSSKAGLTISNSPSRGSYVGKYSILKTLGKGNCGKVKLAIHIPTGENVAIKKIDKTRLNTKELERLSREIRIMKQLDHPNVVKLFQVIDEEKYVYLVMEYAEGGDIFKYLKGRRYFRLEEPEARSKFRQIVSAIHYCHQNNITHRDLKSENILLDGKNNIKLADFGFSREFDSGDQLKTHLGTAAYAAPQLFLRGTYDGPGVDAWALGVILYELVTGTVPFGDTSFDETAEAVLIGKYTLPPYLSVECKNLINKILVVDPSKRISIEGMIKDEWFNMDLESRILINNQPFDIANKKRVEILIETGYSQNEVEESLNALKFDDCYAHYALLSQQISSSTETNGVSDSSISTNN